MSWSQDWPTLLMWASGALFVGSLFAVVRFIRNSSDRGGPPDWPASTAPPDAGSERPRSIEGFVSVGLLAMLVLVAAGATALAHGPNRDRKLQTQAALPLPPKE